MSSLMPPALENFNRAVYHISDPMWKEIDGLIGLARKSYSQTFSLWVLPLPMATVVFIVAIIIIHAARGFRSPNNDWECNPNLVASLETILMCVFIAGCLFYMRFCLGKTERWVVQLLFSLLFGCSVTCSMLATLCIPGIELVYLSIGLAFLTPTIVAILPGPCRISVMTRVRMYR
jgi:hypothetical protein